ncbi:hypothetical protein ACRJ4B_38150 [Streptomyces sp. GTA36]
MAVQVLVELEQTGEFVAGRSQKAAGQEIAGGILRACRNGCLQEPGKGRQGFLLADEEEGMRRQEMPSGPVVRFLGMSGMLQVAGLLQELGCQRQVAHLAACITDERVDPQRGRPLGVVGRLPVVGWLAGGQVDQVQSDQGFEGAPQNSPVDALEVRVPGQCGRVQQNGRDRCFGKYRQQAQQRAGVDGAAVVQ